MLATVCSCKTWLHADSWFRCSYKMFHCPFKTRTPGQMSSVALTSSVLSVSWFSLPGTSTALEVTWRCLFDDVGRHASFAFSFTVAKPFCNQAVRIVLVVVKLRQFQTITTMKLHYLGLFMSQPASERMHKLDEARHGLISFAALVLCSIILCTISLFVCFFCYFVYSRLASTLRWPARSWPSWLWLTAWPTWGPDWPAWWWGRVAPASPSLPRTWCVSSCGFIV